MKKKLFFLFAVGVATFLCVAAESHATTAAVPGDYPTVQQAVTAVQGTTDPKVIINSDGTFTESVMATESVTIEAGTGYTPTIRSASSQGAIYFNPNSASTSSFTLLNLNFLPRTGAGPCSGDSIIQIQNDGSASTTVMLDGLTLNDPDSAGPDGVNIRAAFGTGGPNSVTVQDSTFNLGGGAACGVSAIFMGEEGMLTASNVTINMSFGSSEAFDIRGSQGSGIAFTMVDSTIDISAPLGPYSGEVGRLSDSVTASFQGNTFNLTSNDQGSASGIITGWGSQDVTMDGNLFTGSGPKASSAFSAYPGDGDTVNIMATNNIIASMGSGFSFVPQSGATAGVVNANLTNNTIDGSRTSAIYFSLNDGTTVNGTVKNNIFSHNGEYGFQGYRGTGTTLNITNSHNVFFNNYSGDSDGTVAVGANSPTDDPMFADRMGGDFHIQSGSSGVDAGDPSASSLPATDFEGDPRTQGNGPDIGADESPFTASPGSVTVEDVTVAEGVGLLFTVTLDSDVAGAFTVTTGYTDVTATGGADYDNTAIVLPFAGTAGETQQFTVTTTDDGIVEGTETFTVTLTSSDPLVTDTDTATGTITDNDSAVVTGGSSGGCTIIGEERDLLDGIGAYGFVLLSALWCVMRNSKGQRMKK